MPFSADELFSSPTAAPTPAPAEPLVKPVQQPASAPTGLGTRSVKGKIGGSKPIGLTADQLITPEYSLAQPLKDKALSAVKSVPGMAKSAAKAVGREALSLA